MVKKKIKKNNLQYTVSWTKVIKYIYIHEFVGPHMVNGLLA